MDIAIAEAFADVGAGRKAWRQLRAELKLQNDTLEELLASFTRNTDATSAAILRGFAEAAASEILVRLAAQASVEEMGNEEQVPMAQPVYEDGHHASSPSRYQPAAPSLADVWAELPRLPPGKRGADTEGHEERRRALRRHMQFLLPANELSAIKTATAELRTRGSSYAHLYIELVWSRLATREDAVELMVALIRQQSDTETQVALRAALSELICASNNTFSGRGKETSETSAPSLLSVLDDALMVQVLGFLASAPDLAALLVASRHLLKVAGDDGPWALAEASLFPSLEGLKGRVGSGGSEAAQEANPKIRTWSSWSCPSSSAESSSFLGEQAGGRPARAGAGAGAAAGARKESLSVRTRCLLRLASRCVECGKCTIFEHFLLGWRLCEACEKCHSRYALIRNTMAMSEYQLPERMLSCLPSLDGTTGRVYLRAAVEDLANRLHSKEDLQKLRSRNDVGVSAAGRQRKRGQPTGRSSNQSAAREIRNRGCADHDPCCYEATALRRANIA